MIPGIISGAVTRLTGPIDPYFNNVVLLMHMDGSGTDTRGTTMNLAGTVSYATGRYSQGVSLQTGDSGFVNATTNDTDFAFGTSDFTVEAWVKCNATLPNDGAIVTHFDTFANGWQIYIRSNGTPVFYRYVNGGQEPMTITGVDLRDDQWHHLALVRLNGVIYLYVNGVLPTGATATDVNIYGSQDITLSIGYQVGGGARYPFRGEIDEVRITKGIARYTANFIPPTEPFPNQ